MTASIHSHALSDPTSKQSTTSHITVGDPNFLANLPGVSMKLVLSQRHHHSSFDLPSTKLLLIRASSTTVVNIVSAPTSRTYLPATHSTILEKTNYVIRFERWMNGEKDEIRHFMPHPKHSTTFIELKPSTLAASSRNVKWVPNMRYLKFRCDVHAGPWFTCFVLERRGEVKLEVRSIKRKRNTEIVGGVSEELGSEGGFQACCSKNYSD